MRKLLKTADIAKIMSAILKDWFRLKPGIGKSCDCDLLLPLVTDGIFLC